MKICTYNINGARASNKLGLVEWINKSGIDVFCLQEIRASKEICENIFKSCEYYKYINPADRPGYAGTMILSKIKPNYCVFGLGCDDIEGRVITLYFDEFILVNAYVPNGGSRLDFKLQFVEKLINYLADLNKEKPVILCADMNTAQTVLDLTKPKQCEKVSGYLKQERDLQQKIFEHNFVDILRAKHENELLYTWRSYRSRQVGGDYGWKFRYDYIYCAKSIFKSVKNAEVLDLVYSDHLPIIAILERL